MTAFEDAETSNDPKKELVCETGSEPQVKYVSEPKSLLEIHGNLFRDIFWGC